MLNNRCKSYIHRSFMRELLVVAEVIIYDDALCRCQALTAGPTGWKYKYTVYKYVLEMHEYILIYAITFALTLPASAMLLSILILC